MNLLSKLVLVDDEQEKEEFQDVAMPHVSKQAHFTRRIQLCDRDI